MRTNGFRGTILISWPKACVLSWLQPIFPAPCSGLRTSQGLLPPLCAVAPALASTFLLSLPTRSYKTLLNVSVLESGSEFLIPSCLPTWLSQALSTMGQGLDLGILDTGIKSHHVGTYWLHLYEYAGNIGNY